MADTSNLQPDPNQQQPQTVVMLDPVQQTQLAIAQAAREAEEKQMDETVEGGAYLVNGQWVNAEGKPIKAPKGK